MLSFRFVPGSILEYFFLRDVKLCVRALVCIRGYSTDTSLFSNSVRRATDCASGLFIASGLLGLWAGSAATGVTEEFHRTLINVFGKTLISRYIAGIDRMDLFISLGYMHESDIALTPDLKEQKKQKKQGDNDNRNGISEKIMHFEVTGKPKANLIRNGSNVFLLDHHITSTHGVTVPCINVKSSNSTKCYSSRGVDLFEQLTSSA